MSAIIVRYRKLSIVLLLLFLIGCKNDEDSLGPLVIELKAEPTSVLAGDESVITFRVQPRNDSEIFAWGAQLVTTTAAGGLLDVSRGTVAPLELVTIRFKSKDPTTGEGAAIFISAVDSTLPPSQNSDPVHTVRVIVLPRTP